MRVALVGIVALCSLGAAPVQSRTFTGIISDAMCETSHAGMRMGPTDAACTKACHDEHDAAYVLVTDDRVYQLSDQDAPAAYAGVRVVVTGSLDASGATLVVDSIAPAP
ncbi:MAG: DUF5818 domain-containing protein [Vicinamibacterales bacterium]